MNIPEKPCLIETRQGFSVFYKQHYLYSRYAPSATIAKCISELHIQPGTLILCNSPVLGYGIDGLLQKLPENCFVLAIEHELPLYEFSAPYLEPYLAQHNFKSVFADTEYAFCSLFTDRARDSSTSASFLPPTGTFRRCIAVDFSGGVQLHKNFYALLASLADNCISQFWKNRLTLIKMGRLYARNIFRNLSALPAAIPLQPKSVSRPMLVFGAGGSADTILPLLKNTADRFYIMAVDSALMPLLKHGVIPDSVIAVECQLANEKAFIGAAESGIPLIADITSRPNITRITGGKVSFFLSAYADTLFIETLTRSHITNLVLPPLGSVGLAAIETALFLRTENTPVFFTGLDFAFQAGVTHCKEAPAIRTMLDSANRLSPPGQPAAAFRQGAVRTVCKDGTAQFTDAALSGYAALFSARFSMAEQVYDVSTGGMDLGARHCTPEEMIAYAQQLDGRDTPVPEKPAYPDKQEISARIRTVYETEKAALLRINTILSGADASLIPADAEKELYALLSCREYLYLHFPDAYAGLKTDISFLKRIRAETDFFLKDIQNGIAALDAETKSC